MGLFADQHICHTVSKSYREAATRNQHSFLPHRAHVCSPLVYTWCPSQEHTQQWRTQAQQNNTKKYYIFVNVTNMTIRHILGIFMSHGSNNWVRWFRHATEICSQILFYFFYLETKKSDCFLILVIMESHFFILLYTQMMNMRQYFYFLICISHMFSITSTGSLI